MSAIDHSFRAMGCDLRVVAEADGHADEDLAAAVQRVERFIRTAAARLTRFDAESELCRASGLTVVSPLLRRAVAVALGAARTSGGLIDPTLAAAVTHAGYGSTFEATRRADLRELLDAAPPRRPARPRPDARWQQITVDDHRSTVALPRGAHLDLGATAKGLLADLALRLLGPVDRAFVDAGGDVAMHTTTTSPLLAADPFGDAPATLTVAPGTLGVATSSIAGRCWWHPNGAPAHHLLDPATGAPAFTGVVQATAAAPSTAEAERLAGQALLSGPIAARHLLSTHGGVLVLDDASTIRIEGALLR